MNPHEEIAPEVGRPRVLQPAGVEADRGDPGRARAVNLLIAFAIVWVLFLANGQAVAIEAGRSGREGVRPPSGCSTVATSSSRSTGSRAAPTRCAISSRPTAAPGRRSMAASAKTPAKIVVERNGTLLTFELRPRYSAADQRPLVGFEFGSTQESVGPVHAASLTVSGAVGRHQADGLGDRADLRAPGPQAAQQRRRGLQRSPRSRSRRARRWRCRCWR